MLALNIFKVNDNKIIKAASSSKANKIAKILAISKNIKKLSKGKYLKQLDFLTSKANSLFFIKNSSN